MHNICLKKVKAKKRIAWIHTDYSIVNINKDIELPIWSQFDYISSISDATTTAYLSVFPELEHKIVKIENILAPNFVRQRANINLPDYNINDLQRSNTITLLTIGRFCHQKNSKHKVTKYFFTANKYYCFLLKPRQSPFDIAKKDVATPLPKGVATQQNSH